MSGKTVSIRQHVRDRAPDAEGAALVLMLRGSAMLGTGPISAGQAALAGSVPIPRADDCWFAVIDGLAACHGTAPVEPRDMGHFRRYRSRVAEIAFDASLAWSVYDVAVDGREAQCELHVHHDVRNMVFVWGSDYAPVADLIIATDDGIFRWPLCPGDGVLVLPGTEHSIVARSAAGVQMFVVNDSRSNYGDLATADFHVTRQVDWRLVREGSPPGGSGRLLVPRAIVQMGGLVS